MTVDEANAASRINAAARGRADRAMVGRMQQEYAEQLAREEAAATKIGAVARGHQQKRQLLMQQQVCAPG